MLKGLSRTTKAVLIAIAAAVCYMLGMIAGSAYLEVWNTL